MNKNILFFTLLTLASHSILCDKKSTAVNSEQAVKIGEKKMQNIKKLFSMTMNKEKMLQMMKASVEQVNAQFGVADKLPKKLKKLSNDLFEEVSDAITSDTMLQNIANIYDKYFTAEDVENIIKFYESETGKKTLTVMPQMMGELMQVTLGSMQDSLKKYLSEVEKYQKQQAEKATKKKK